MTSMEKAHRAERIAAEHQRINLDVRILSPRIVVAANPESDTGTQLVLDLGNIAVATFFEAELVVLGAGREVIQDRSDQQIAFIRSFSSDIANALEIPVADVCHVTVVDATVPAPEGAEFSELRH